MSTKAEDLTNLKKKRDEYLTKAAFSHEMTKSKVVGNRGVGNKTILCRKVNYKCVEFLDSHREKYGFDSAHIELDKGIVTMNFSHFPTHMKLMKWARKQDWYMKFIKQQKTSISMPDKYADALHKFMIERILK
jgi:hypothetical protein